MKASCDSEVKASLESYLKDGDEKRLSDLSTRLRIFAKMDQAISSVYLVIPDKRQVVTTMDYPVYKSGIEEEKIQQFLKKCGKDTGPVIMEDLVHNQEKLLQFIEEVTDTQGNVMGYVCTNIEEENLSYDYLEDTGKSGTGSDGTDRKREDYCSTGIVTDGERFSGKNIWKVDEPFGNNGSRERDNLHLL